MAVQDELRARLLPDECTADINRIFIHTEGSVRAQPGELVSSHHYPRARARARAPALTPYSTYLPLTQIPIPSVNDMAP